MNFCIQLTQPWSICNYYDTALSQKNSFIHFPFDTNLEHRAAFTVSVITHTIRQTVGLLWTNDQPVAETSTYTWQQHINTIDKHPCPEQNLNPRPQQPSGRRPTP
jgi:hypothetical protein